MLVLACLPAFYPTLWMLSIICFCQFLLLDEQIIIIIRQVAFCSSSKGRAGPHVIFLMNCQYKGQKDHSRLTQLAASPTVLFIDCENRIFPYSVLGQSREPSQASLLTVLKSQKS